VRVGRCRAKERSADKAGLFLCLALCFLSYLRNFR
jgi:hypothetical protein